MRVKTLLVLLIPGILSGCGESDAPGQKAAPEMPRFTGKELGKGRGIWMGTCRNCHLLGISGAPAVTDYPAWKPRIAKGQGELYRSALNGVKGADGKFRMPPRGGNAQLEDEQVRLAVDYMVRAVEKLNEAGD